jgi:hypothetical protein
MMYSNLRFVFVWVVSLVWISCPAWAAEDHLVGSYRVEGIYASGKKYGTGTVTIAKRGASYMVVWSGFGEPAFKGVGILEGDVFAANFVDSSDGDGVMLLRRDVDKWVGKWVVVPGNGELHQETWIKVK